MNSETSEPERSTGTVRGAGLLLIAVALFGCATKSLQHDEWYVLETSNFRVVSTYGVAGARALALDLEAFHSSVVFFSGMPELPPQKTRVIAFDDRTITRPFSQAGAPGYYLPNLRGGTIVLRTNSGWRGDATLRLRHLYAHEVVRNRFGLTLPLWLDEGLAQYQSTIAVSGRKSQLGRLREDHVELLRDRLGIDAVDLIGRRNRLDMGHSAEARFDAMSWALVHWIFSRQGRGNPSWMWERIERYGSLIRQGRSVSEAFEQSFDVSVSEVDSDLIEYVRGEQFLGVPLRFNDLAESLVATPMASADARNELGWLAIELNKSDLARKFFEFALEEEPSHASALAGMGAAARLDHEWDEAEQFFRKAMVSDREDALLWLEGGIYLTARAMSDLGAADRVESLERARDSYRKSLAFDSSLPDTHAQTGASFLVEGEDARGGLPEVRHARQLQPSSLAAVLLEARLHAAAGGARAAHGLAEVVHALSHDDAQREAAYELIEAYGRGRTLIGR